MRGPASDICNEVCEYDNVFQSIHADFLLSFIHQNPDLSVIIDPTYQPCGFLGIFSCEMMFLEVISDTELELICCQLALVKLRMQMKISNLMSKALRNE